MERLIKNLRLVNFLLVIGLTLFGVPLPIFALPEGGQVVSGQASINVDGSNLTVTQGSNRAIVNWESFSIGEAELVQILQPGSSSAHLSRVVGGDPSSILGQLLSNGQVFLINPNGIVFGTNSKVNVASLFASTLDIADQDFLSGKYRFLQDPGKALSFIVNRGEIRVADGGYVVIAAPLVNNEGVIIANLGQVKLAGTSELGLDISGTGLINISVGKVVNPGTVELPTDLATALIKAVVNTEGLVPAGDVVESGGVTRLVGAEGVAVNAGSVYASGGDILLQGGQAVVNAGVLDTRTGAAEGNYGKVEISGSNFQLLPGQQVRTGSFVLDPLNVFIAEGAGSEANTYYEDDIEMLLDAGTDVTISADNSITILNFTTLGDEGINVTGSGNLTLLIDDSEPPLGDGVGTISFANHENFIRMGTGNLVLDAQTNANTLGGTLQNIGALSSDGGDITLLAGGNIELLNDVSVTGGGQIRIDSTLGALTLGANVDISSATTDILIAANNFTQVAGGTIDSNGNQIDITAKNVNIGGTILSDGGQVNFNGLEDGFVIAATGEVDAGTGDVVLGTVAGATVDLGFTGTGSLQISDNTLDGITTSGVIYIGDAGTGDIAIGAVSLPGSAVEITSGGVILDDGTLNTGITAASVSLVAGSIGTEAAPVGINTGGGVINADTSGGAGSGEINLVETSGDLLLSQVGINTDPGLQDVRLTALTGAIDLDASVSFADNLTLTADVINLDDGGGNSLDLGSGHLLIKPYSNNQPINLGTKQLGALSLTDAELDNIDNAASITIGSTRSGALTISAAISPAGTSTLMLIAGDTAAEGIGGSGSITVDNLALDAAGAIGSAGDYLDVAVDNLAARSRVSGDIYLVESDDLVITGVTANANTLAGVSTTASDIDIRTADGTITVESDVVAGNDGNIILLAGSTGSTADVVVNANVYSNTAGDVMIQAANAISTDGSGYVGGNTVALVAADGSIGDAVNPILTRAAILGAQASEVTAAADIYVTEEAGGGDLEIGQATDLITGGGATIDGVTTTGGDGDLVIATENGDLLVSQNVIAVNDGSIELIAGGAESSFTNSGGVIDTDDAAITITADNFNLVAGSIGSNNEEVTLQPFTGGRGITLGADLAGSLSLEQSELDTIGVSGGSGILNIGAVDQSSGAIAVNGDIDLSGISDLLHLWSGAGVVGIGTVTVGDLAVSAGGAVTLNTLVTNLAIATDGDVTVVEQAADIDGLTIELLDGVNGVDAGSGDIVITLDSPDSTADLIVNAPILTTGTGSIELVVSNENNLVLQAPISTTGGDVSLRAGGNIDFNAGASLLTHDGAGGDAGAVLVYADTDDGGNGSVTTVLGADIDTDSIGGLDANITLVAADLILAGNIAAGDAVVSFVPTAGNSINLGSGAANFGLSNAELGLVTSAGRIEVGSDGVNTASGDILLDGDINSLNAATLVLTTTGEILDDDAGLGWVVAVDNLALIAGTGVAVSSANYLNINVDNLAGVVTAAGNIYIIEQDEVTIGELMTNAGVVTGLTTFDGSIELNTLDGSITVDQPVVAGDDSHLGWHVSLSAAAGGNNADILVNSEITADFGDVELFADNEILLNGSINSGNDVYLTAGIGGISGAISWTDGLITAVGLVKLDALDGIGAVGASIKTEAAILTAHTTNNDIYITEASGVDVGSGVNYNGITAGGGDIYLENITGDLTVSESVTTLGPGSITLSVLGAGDSFILNTVGLIDNVDGVINIIADDMVLTAGAIGDNNETVILRPQDLAREISLGADVAGQLSLENAELALVNVMGGTGTLIIGQADGGNIDINGDIDLSGSADILHLISGYDIAGASTITANDLALTSTIEGDIDVMTAVATVAAETLDGDIRIAQQGSNDLTVGSVDGVVGLSAGGSDVVVTTADGDLTVDDDIFAAGTGSITLTAGDGDDDDGFVRTFTNNAVINAAGGDVIITADNMTLDGTLDSQIIAGGDEVVLKMYQTSANSNALIRLDAADAFAAGPSPDGVALGLSDSELGTITAARLTIGASNGPGIDVQGSVGSYNIDTLQLVSGLDISNTTGAGAVITVGSLALLAETGIGSGGLTIYTNVDELAAINNTNGDIDISEADALTIGQVAGVVGVTNNAGNVTIVAAGGDISVNENVSAAGAGSDAILAAGGDIALAAEVSAADDVQLQAVGEIIQLSGGKVVGDQVFLDATDGIGTVTDPIFVNANTLGAQVTAPGGGIYIDEEDAVTIGQVWDLLGGPVAFDGIATNAGDVQIRLTQADHALTVVDNLSAATVRTSGGDITLVADAMVFNTAGAQAVADAGAGDILLQTFDAATIIGLGSADSATVLGLTAAELLKLTSSGTVVIGDASNTGGIRIAANLDLSAANFDNLALITGDTGAGTIGINDLTAGAGGNLLTLSASSTLTLIAEQSIDVSTAVSTLTASSTSGDIWVEEADALDIGAGYGIDGISGAGAIYVATANGDLNTVNGAGGIETTGLSETIALIAGGENDLTINDYIRSNGGTITLTAGRDVALNNAAAQVRSHDGLGGDAGLIDVNADSNGDGAGELIMVAGSALDANSVDGTDADIHISAADFAATGATIDAGSGRIYINPSTSTAVGIGTEAAGFDMVEGDFTALNADGGVILGYDPVAGINASSINMTADVDAGSDPLTLVTTGNIDGGNFTLSVSNTLTLDANTGIGGTSGFFGDAFAIDALSLAARTRTSGDIIIYDISGFTVTSAVNVLAPFDGVYTGPGSNGNIYLDTDTGDLVVDQPIVADGTGDIWLAASAADVDINNPISSTAGQISIIGDNVFISDDVTTGGGTYGLGIPGIFIGSRPSGDIIQDAGSISTTGIGGGIEIDAGRDFVQTSPALINSADYLTIAAGRDIVIDPATAETFIDLRAVDDIIITGDLTATNSHIYLRANNDGILGNDGDAGIYAGGNVIFDGTGGPITITASDADSDGDGVVLILGENIYGLGTAAGDITFNVSGSLPAGDGDLIPFEFALALLAEENIGSATDPVLLTANLGTGSFITIADADLSLIDTVADTFSHDPDVVAAGHLDFAVGVVPDGTGQVYMDANSIINSMDIVIIAPESIVLDEAVYSALGDILVWSTANSITVNSGVSLEAGLDGNPATSGSITLLGQTGVTILAGTALTPTSIIAEDAVTITAVTGDVLIGEYTTIHSGHIMVGDPQSQDTTITATAGSIYFTGTNGNIDIDSYGNVFLSALNDITPQTSGDLGAGNIRARFGNVSAIATTGDVDLDQFMVLASIGDVVLHAGGSVSTDGTISVNSGYLDVQAGTDLAGGDGAFIQGPNGILNLSGNLVVGPNVAGNNIAIFDSVGAGSDVVTFNGTVTAGHITINLDAANIPGNIVIGGYLESGGNVYIATDNGASNGIIGGGNILADQITLRAPGSGADDGLASIDIGNLDARQWLHLTAADDVTTGSLTAGANNAGYAIRIDANDDLGAVGSVTVNGLTTANAHPGLNVLIDPVQVGINGNVSVSGNYQVWATGDINLNANINAVGNVDLYADSTSLGVADPDVSSGDDFTQLTGTYIQAGGTISITGDNLTLQTLTAGVSINGISNYDNTGAAGNISLGGNLKAPAVSLQDNGGSLNLDLLNNVLIQTTNTPLVLNTASLDGNYGLTLQTGSGAVTLGTVGSVTPLNNLTVNTTGQTDFNGNITVVNDLDFGSATGGYNLAGASVLTSNSGDIDLGGGDIFGANTLGLSALNGLLTLSTVGAGVHPTGLVVSGAAALLRGDIVVDGDVNFGGVGVTTLGGDRIIDASGGAASTLTLGPVQGAYDLTLIQGADDSVVLNGISQLTGLYINDGLGSGPATIAFNGAATLSGDVMAEAVDSISVNAPITSTGGLIGLYVDNNNANAGTINVNANLIGSDVTLQALDTAAGASVINIGADLSNPRGGYAIDVGDGTLNILNDISALTFIDINNSNGITNLGADLLAAGPVTLNDNVNLTAPATVTSLASNVDFGGDVSGANILTVNAASGTVTFNSIGWVGAWPTGLLVNSQDAVFNSNGVVNGNINVSASDDIEVNDWLSSISGTGTVTLTAGDDLNIGMTADAALSTMGGDITLTAHDLYLGDAANVNAGQLFTVFGGNIKLDVAGDVVMNANTTGGSASLGTVIASGGWIDIDPINVVINGAGLTAVGDIDVTADNTITVLANVTADNNADNVGDVTMTAGGIFNAGTATTISGESVNITGGGSVALGIVTADVAGNGAGNIDVVAADALAINNNLTAGSVSGVITLTSQSGLISVGGNVTAPNVTIDSQGSYIANTGGTIIATDLTLLAQTGIGTAGAPMEVQISNLLASTASGDIYVEDTGSLTVGIGGQGVTNLGSGFTSLSADDGIVIAADIFSNGDVELNADLDVDNLGAITWTAGLVTADDLNLVAAQGIGTTVAPILTSVTTLGASNSSSGVIALVEADDAALNLVSNPGRDVYLSAGGSLTDNNGASTTNVAGANLYLSTGGYVDLDTDVSALNDWLAYGNIGQDLTIRELDSITLGSNTILSTSDGDIDIRTAGGTITVTNLVAGGTGDVRLVAGGGGSDIEIGLITALDDQVWLTAADAITELAPDGAIDVTAGELALEAANGIGSANALETAVSRLSAYNSTSNDIRVDNNLASGLTIDTVAGIVGVTNLGGGVYINEASPLTVASPVLAVGPVVLTANNTVAGDGTGDMFINASVESTGSSVLLDADDSIYLAADVDAATTATIRADGEGDGFGLIAWTGGVVTAPTVVLDAAQGIGATGWAVQTSATTFTATSDNGDVVVVNDNVNASTAATLSTGTGNIDVTQTGGGSLTVTSATTGAGDITLTVVGANLTANVVTAGGAGDVYLNTLTSGDIYVNNVTAAGDQITASSAGAIEESGADGGADLTAQVLDLNAVTGIGVLAPIETAATTISADSVNGNIDLDNALGTAVTASSLTTGTGNILFSQTGGGALTVTLARTDVGNIGIDVTGANLTVVTATAGALGGGFGDGNITLTTTTSGNISVDNVTALLDVITINSAGEIVENGDAGVDLRSGTLALTALTGIGSANAIETSAVNIGATTGTGNLRLNNDNAGATVASNLSVTGGSGYIEFNQTGGGSLTVNSATTNGGDITVNVTGADLVADTVTAGGTGDIYLSTLTSGNVLLDNITALDDLIRVTSAGAIEESGSDGAADLTAFELDLNAVTGIGVAGTIETAATQIAADSTDGDVVLANSNTAAVTATSLTTGIGDVIFSQAGGGALTVNNAQTTAGDIDISVTSANLTVLTATAGTFGLIPDGDIRLTTTGSGNIYVGNVTAGNDLITVTSAGAIEESGADGGADLTAGELDLNAVTGIGAAAALETSAQQIAADSTNGNINLDNSSVLDVTVSSLTTGTGSLLFSQAGGGSLTVENAVTGNGPIGLDVTGADLTALVVTAGGAGQNVTLTSFTSGDVFVENVTAAGDQITVTSAGAIEEYGAGDDGADLTATTLDLNAVTGIGTSASAPIETSATAIAADSTNGNISLANSNTAAVTVSSLTTGIGDIYFSQTGGGVLTVTNSDTADGDITLENTGADLIANTVTAGGSGDVLLQTLVSGDVYVNNITAWADLITVNSAGRIDESGADGGADLTAAELDLNATTGIGVGGALEVSASTIAADSVGSGAVNLNSLATGPVLVTSLTTGTFGGAIEVGAITFSQTGNQPLTVQLASTQEGDISIANAGADLTVYEATAGAAAGSNISNLALSATGGGADVFIDNLRAEDDQISITAPLGEIAEIGMGDPEIDLTARILSLIAYTGIGAANPIETDAEELGADNYTNAIQIDNTGDLVLRGVTDDYGDIWIYTEGDLTVQNMTIGYQTVVESVFGNVELYASEDILVNDNVRGLGDVLLVADATRATAFAAGPVSLGLYAPENELGGIYMAGGTSVTSSGSGVVELVASEDIELGLVAAGAGTGIIYSGLGAIIDNNLDDNNVLAEDLVMHANLGIGTLADRLETAVTNLAAENITSGELALTNTASQDNWPVPGDGIPELILATLLDVNTPIGGLTLSVDGLTNLGGGVHLRELAGDILDNVPPTTEVIPFSMDVVANGNSTLESDNGVIGWWNDPLEVNVVGSLTAGALGDPSRNHLISVNLAGIVTPSDQVELPYETPGLVMFNWHIMGDGVLLQALREAQSSLDIERADDFDASFFGPLILDVVTDVWMLPEVPEIEVVVEDASGKVRKLASL